VSDPVENKKRKISHSDDGEGGPSGGDGEGGPSGGDGEGGPSGADGEGGPSGGDGEGGPSGGDGEVGDEAFDKYAGELRRFFKRQTQLLDNKFEDLKYLSVKRYVLLYSPRTETKKAHEHPTNLIHHLRRLRG